MESTKSVTVAKENVKKILYCIPCEHCGAIGQYNTVGIVGYREVTYFCIACGKDINHRKIDSDKYNNK